MQDVINFTPEQINSLPRGEVRYTLFRLRAGNPEQSHYQILNHFIPRLNRYNLAISEFSETWDISKTGNTDIVSGHVVHLFKEEAKSLFNEDGTLKE
jgi:hypothetical protein